MPRETNEQRFTDLTTRVNNIHACINRDIGDSLTVIAFNLIVPLLGGYLLVMRIIKPEIYSNELVSSFGFPIVTIYAMWKSIKDFIIGSIEDINKNKKEKSSWSDKLLDAKTEEKMKLLAEELKNFYEYALDRKSTKDPEEE